MGDRCDDGVGRSAFDVVRHSVGCSAFSRRHSVVALLAPVAEEEEALQHVDACIGGVAMITHKQTTLNVLLGVYLFSQPVLGVTKTFNRAARE